MIKSKRCKPFDSRFLELDLTKNQKEVYIAYGKNQSVVNHTADSIGGDPGTISKTIRAIQDKALGQFGALDWDDVVNEIVEKELKILVFDIETMFHTVAVWGFYNVNVAHNQVIDYGRAISFAARWLGTEEIIYHECRGKNNKRLIKAMMKLFDEADIVVAHNGRAFDVKTMRGEALKHGLKPPSPFKVADTLTVAKGEFKLPRNTLEFIAEYVGVAPKLKHSRFPGMTLWMECAKGNKEAWEEMKEYNIGDIDTLEEVYYKLRQWDSKAPNVAIFQEETRSVCPKCGSGELKKTNPVRTNTQMYHGFRCRNCNGLARSRTTISDKDKRKALLVNAV